MQIKLNEYKGRLRDAGRRVSNDDIAKATGIGISTVDKISMGAIKEFRGEYIDALTAYFADQLGVEVEQISLVQAEPIRLPLTLNIRPDRHGKRVGQTGDAPAPAPTENDSQPPIAVVASAIATAAAEASVAIESAIGGAVTAASLATRQRQALIPPVAEGSGGTPGARDVEREAALEERRRALLEQAAGRG